MSTKAVPAAYRPYDAVEPRIERLLRADFRLVYGMAVPILIVTGAVVALATDPEWWMLAPMMLLVALLTAVVAVGFNHVMSQYDDR
jgi:hypothetical protein